ncbi:MAG: hypothetical protein O2931_12555 [Planctomycetota bacterium]|nr:hypothetical protein [Planctomycetota bacterium]MDA1179616.1 hypothetical protein [Planctomycetota bacterium]
MNNTLPEQKIRLPDDLCGQLIAFRRRVWTLKLSEAFCIAVSALITVVVTIFLADRVGDTPWMLRAVLITAVMAVFTLIPYRIYRWVWRRRSLPQVARLVAHRSPQIGDRLLGVLELVENPSEQARSPELCQAAVRQVAEESRRWDLSQSLPPTRNQLWRNIAASGIVVMAVLSAVLPLATWNAMQRSFFPWRSLARYTFAKFVPLPDRLVIPHGETHLLTIQLDEGSVWLPRLAELQIGQQTRIQATQESREFRLELPPQISEAPLSIRIGDAQQAVTLVPIQRPELKSVEALVSLPSYLQHTENVRKDVRSGTVSLVEGSQVTIVAQANRELAQASVDGLPRVPQIDTVTSDAVPVAHDRSVQFRWQDTFGLQEKEPFTLNLIQAADEPPTISCEGLAKQRVVLDIEQLQFGLQGNDDFGVQEVGMEWQGTTTEGLNGDTRGERLLSVGGPQQATLAAIGTFNAQSLQISPQAIQLRIYVTDYLPNRPRVYSPTFTLYVLDVDQHAIWMTEQLNKWHRQALEVRDRELQLFETNKELRALSTEELNDSETRNRIEQQAAAERGNGRRLQGLTVAGEDLVRQAARNPEFGVGHLEKWAEMLQLLQDISDQRMPSVADLLKEAAKSPQLASATKSSPSAGTIRRTDTGASPPDSATADAQKAAVPTIVDRESSQQPAANGESPESPPPSNNSAPTLRLPVTTLAGLAKQGGDCPVGKKMDEALAQQQDLLTEFEKIANELNTVLANLEGSTLVKRLKAASREQYRIATNLGALMEVTFGRKPHDFPAPQQEQLEGLTKSEVQDSDNVSYILDDMHAYFERRPLLQFKQVMEEMRKSDVVGALRQVSGDLQIEQGLSMAQCEYWSDNLDRWAEDLVDPARGGT